MYTLHWSSVLWICHTITLQAGSQCPDQVCCPLNGADRMLTTVLCGHRRVKARAATTSLLSTIWSSLMTQSSMSTTEETGTNQSIQGFISIRCCYSFHPRGSLSALLASICTDIKQLQCSRRLACKVSVIQPAQSTCYADQPGVATDLWSTVFKCQCF